MTRTMRRTTTLAPACLLVAKFAQAPCQRRHPHRFLLAFETALATQHRHRDLAPATAAAAARLHLRRHHPAPSQSALDATRQDELATEAQFAIPQRIEKQASVASALAPVVAVTEMESLRAETVAVVVASRSQLP